MHNVAGAARRHRPPNPPLQRIKPLSLHFGLFVFIFVYAFLGGLMFTRIESEATREREFQLQRQQHECVMEKLGSTDPNVINAGENANRTAEDIVNCFKQEVDVRSQWGYVTGTLYGFGIITTLGYNRIAPVTTTGRLLCVLYGLCGIPCCMIIVANLGQYFNGLAGFVKSKAIKFRMLAMHLSRQRRLSKGKTDEEEMKETSTEMIGLALLVAFMSYVTLGAILLPLLNGEFDFLNGIYHNFLCLTAIDFGTLVPSRVEFLPITFIYVCVGLAITTVAIEIGSEYMKKLHHLGQNLRNVAQTKVWFGGKTLKVRDLLHAVGKKCGVDPNIIDNMDLENIVERAVAINEGREPPPDTNEDSEPPEPEPSLPSKDENDNHKPPPPEPDVEKQPLLRYPLISTFPIVIDPPSPVEIIDEKPPFDICNFVAIDVEFNDEPYERGLDFQEPVVVSRPMETRVAVSADIALPQEVEHHAPVVILQDDESKTQAPSDEPKKFLEKKQKYGRDPKKLYATYQEEWDRLEKLGQKRLGNRRKSVLTTEKEEKKEDSTTSTAASSRKTSPVRGNGGESRPSPRQSPVRNVNSSDSNRLKPESPTPPMRQRSPSRGAVQAAKEALERRASQNLELPALTMKEYVKNAERIGQLVQPYLPYAAIPLGIYGLYKLICRLIPGPHQQAKLNVRNRTVLITGASSGLGRALAFEFYRRGAKLILTARSIDKLKELCEELEAKAMEWDNPHKPEFRYLDLAELTDEAQFGKSLAEIQSLALKDGIIDVLVNNAGRTHRGGAIETSFNVHKQIMDVNYFGQLAITKALYNSIPDDGAIVTIGSVQSKLAVPYRSPYSTSKHALQALMDCLRCEGRPQLQILFAAPGYLNTGFATRGLTPTGGKVGKEDFNQLRGYSPEYAAQRIIKSLINRESELLLAPLTSAFIPILLRFFAPNLLFWLLHRRGQKLLEHEKFD